MSTQTPRAASHTLTFPYINCRNISLPDMWKGSEKCNVHTGYAPASSFLGLDDEENVRKYILEVDGKKRKVPSMVHRAIRDTLENHIDRFHLVNGGISILADGATIDDSKKCIEFKNASIINGSQTRGELKRYLANGEEGQNYDPPVRFEVIVTDDQELVQEIAISRNYQNAVQPISIAGRRDQLQGLNACMTKKFLNKRIQLNETDLGDDVIDTIKLLQVTFALVPASLFSHSRTQTYSQKTKWLNRFADIYEAQKKGDPGAKEQYQCLLDLAPVAWELYGRWKNNAEYGKGLRAKRVDGKSAVKETSDGNREIVDGLVFPIIAAHSLFVEQKEGNWDIAVPKGISDKMLINASRTAYFQVAYSNPQTMGKSEGCYSLISLVCQAAT